MSASIGKGSLVLTANARPLASDLTGAHSKITSWAGRVKASVGGVLSGVGKLAAPVFVAQMAFKAIAETVGVFAEQTAEIANIGRTARTLGIDPAELQALGNAAKRVGVELPEFGQMFGKLQAKIAQGGPETAAALGQIGLSLESLQGMSGRDALYAIADGLAGTQDAGAKSAVAMKLFEEAGLKLLPMLSKGGAGLRAMVAEQKASGAVLSKSQIAVAEVADAAMTKAGEAISMVWNKIVIAVAPVVTALAEVASVVADVLSPVFEFFGKLATGVFKAVAYAAAYTWDTIKVGAAAGALGMSLLVDSLGLVFRAIKNVLSVAAHLPYFLGGGWAEDGAKLAEGTQNWLEGKAKGMRDWATRQANGWGDNAKALGDYFDSLKEKKDDATDMSGAIGQINQMTKAVQDSRAKAKSDMGAIFKGSAEDYSLRTSFAMGDMSGTEPVVAAIRVLTEVQQKALDKMPDRERVADPITLKDF